jgi:hypothetical protein
VNSFGARATTVVAVWLGLAMLGQGPRASAAFWPGLSPAGQPATSADEGGLAAAPAAPTPDEQPPNAWPADNSDGFPFLHCQWAACTSSGGAGAPSSPPSGSAPSSPLLAGGVEVPPPALVGRLHTARTLLILPQYLASIFEPPKAAI